MFSRANTGRYNVNFDRLIIAFNSMFFIRYFSLVFEKTVFVIFSSIKSKSITPV